MTAYTIASEVHVQQGDRCALSRQQQPGISLLLLLEHPQLLWARASPPTSAHVSACSVVRPPVKIYVIIYRTDDWNWMLIIDNKYWKYSVAAPRCVCENAYTPIYTPIYRDSRFTGPNSFPPRGPVNPGFTVLCINWYSWIMIIIVIKKPAEKDPSTR